MGDEAALSRLAKSTSLAEAGPAPAFVLAQVPRHRRCSCGWLCPEGSRTGAVRASGSLSLCIGKEQREGVSGICCRVWGPRGTCGMSPLLRREPGEDYIALPTYSLSAEALFGPIEIKDSKLGSVSEA